MISLEFEKSVKRLILELCEVMHKNGYDKVNIGAVMRLVGVNDESAREHDCEYMMLDADFEKNLAELKAEKALLAYQASNRTLH